MTKYIVFILVMAVGIGGWVWWRRARAATATNEQDRQTALVARNTILRSVSSSGRVVSNLDVDIKCKASGTVVRLPFDISQRVKAGDLLVELDPIDETRAVKLSEVALAQSQARHAQAQQNARVAELNLQTARLRAAANVQSSQARATDLRAKAQRRKDLLDQKLGSREDYDSAEAAAIGAETDLVVAKVAVEELTAQEVGVESRRQDVKLAEAAVQADELTLANARQRLADTKVVAPMAGVVSDRKVQIGTIISSGITNVGGGTTLLVLSDLSRMFVLASVDESEIGKVREDQPVVVTVDAYPETQFDGKVVRIGTKGVNVSNVVTFEVKVEITSDNKALLKPEMTASVQIIADRKEDVLSVPTTALSRKDGKTLATVVKADGSTEDRPVELGLTDGTHIEVLAGLTEGEQVVLRKGEADSKFRGAATQQTGSAPPPPPPGGRHP